MLPAVKVKVPKNTSGKLKLPAPQRPRIDNGVEAEVLTGQVNGMKASAGEERFARALSKITAIDGFQFRYTIGAPRGLPGWKELDFVVVKGGILYGIEVDTAFTHRDKKASDALHDAIALKELAKLGYQLHPVIIHLDGESDLADQNKADQTAKRMFL